MKGRKYFVFLSAVSLLFLWQLLSVKVGYDFILPAPVQVLTRMGSLLLEQTFYEAIGATAIRSLFGLMLAFFLAAVFALLSFKSDRFAAVVCSFIAFDAQYSEYFIYFTDPLLVFKRYQFDHHQFSDFFFR